MRNAVLRGIKTLTKNIPDNTFNQLSGFGKNKAKLNIIFVFDNSKASFCQRLFKTVLIVYLHLAEINL